MKRALCVVALLWACDDGGAPARQAPDAAVDGAVADGVADGALDRGVDARPDARPADAARDARAVDAGRDARAADARAADARAPDATPRDAAADAPTPDAGRPDATPRDAAPAPDMRPLSGAAEPCVDDEECASDSCFDEASTQFPGGFCNQLCAADDECSPGTRCLELAGFCVAPCAADGDCRPDYICVQFCQPTCDIFGCPEASVCNADTGRCEQPGGCEFALDLNAQGAVDGVFAYAGETGFRSQQSTNCEGFALGDGGEEILRFAPPEPGVWRVETADPDLDTVVYVRQECAVPDTQLGCNDDVDIANARFNSRLDVQLDGPVFIFVDTLRGGSQRYEVSVRRLR